MKKSKFIKIKIISISDKKIIKKLKIKNKKNIKKIKTFSK